MAIKCRADRAARVGNRRAQRPGLFLTVNTQLPVEWPSMADPPEQTKALIQIWFIIVSQNCSKTSTQTVQTTKIAAPNHPPPHFSWWRICKQAWMDDYKRIYTPQLPQNQIQCFGLDSITLKVGIQENYRQIYFVGAKFSSDEDHHMRLSKQSIWQSPALSPFECHSSDTPVTQQQHILTTMAGCHFKTFMTCAKGKLSAKRISKAMKWSWAL